MPKLSNPYKQTITVSSGTGAFTFSNLKNMSLVALFVKPANDTTKYDITIVDVNSFTVFKESDLYKRYSKNNLHDLPNIIVGNFTLTIDADNDEDFGIELYISEDL